MIMKVMLLINRLQENEMATPAVVLRTDPDPLSEFYSEYDPMFSQCSKARGFALVDQNGQAGRPSAEPVGGDSNKIFFPEGEQVWVAIEYEKFEVAENGKSRRVAHIRFEPFEGFATFEEAQAWRDRYFEGYDIRTTKSNKKLVLSEQ